MGYEKKIKVSDKRVKTEGVFVQFINIRHLHISHNEPYLPPKILHNLCFSFLLGITAVPREVENNTLGGGGVANKVHYGRCVIGIFSNL